MASGSIYLTSEKKWRGTINWSSTTNVAGNYSDVYIYAGMWKTDGYWTSNYTWTSGTITVDGASYDLIAYQEFKDEVCIFEDTIRVYHNSDGNKTIGISLTCYGQEGTKLEGYPLSGSGNAELDTIPRSSTLSAGNGTLGSEMSLGINRQSDSFTHTITYKCGNATGTICEKTSSTKVKWVPPESLATQSTKSSTLSVTLTLTAYSGSTEIGTDTVSIKLSIPNSVAPSLSVALSDNAGCLEKYGAYIQSKSAVSVVITADGIYGSTISGYQVTFDEKTYTGAQIVTEAIKGSGDLTLVAKVTDSRGKTASLSVSVSVMPYSPPAITSLVVQRCDADGTRNASGGYLAVVFDAEITTLNSKNSAAYTLKYKKSADSVYTSVALKDLAGLFAVNDYQYIFKADKGSSYNVVIHIKDDFPGVEKSAVGPSRMTVWSYFTSGMGYAIGKVAERIGYLDMGFHIHLNGNRLHGLPDPEDDDDAAPKGYVDNLVDALSAKIYPVGAIYISTTDISPASLFGGKWERIEDVFLLAAGSTYAAGATGGEAAHVLIEKEMPRHRHYGVRRNTVGDSGGHSTGASTDSSNTLPYTDYAGGGEAHNNMPPYLAVYVWKRVA